MQVDNEIFSCDMAEEKALLHVTSNKYYGLNPVGARIWSLLQEQPRTVKEIYTILLGEYEVEPETLETDLHTFLNELRASNLIKVETEQDA